MLEQWFQVMVQLVNAACAALSICTVLLPLPVFSATSDDVNSMVDMAYTAGIVHPCCNAIHSTYLKFCVGAVLAQTLPKLGLSHEADMGWATLCKVRKADGCCHSLAFLKIIVQVLHGSGQDRSTSPRLL